MYVMSNLQELSTKDERLVSWYLHILAFKDSSYLENMYLVLDGFTANFS